MTTTSTLLSGMIAAAHEVGALILSRPVPPLTTTLDEFRSTFGAIEAPAEALLRERLEMLRPGVAWADEFDIDLPPGEQRWVVDILDGAVQYMQGLPHWCVSITLVEDRSAVAAVLVNPLRNETYSAAEGFGAMLDATPIAPSRKTELAATLVGTSQPPFVGAQPDAAVAAGRSLSAVVTEVGAVRNLGPTSWQIADVASGRMDAFWEFGLDDGNLLGASLVAREAGAVVTDADGAPWGPGADSFLAAPGPLHALLLALLRAR